MPEGKDVFSPINQHVSLKHTQLSQIHTAFFESHHPNAKLILGSE